MQSVSAEADEEPNQSETHDSDARPPCAWEDFVDIELNENFTPAPAHIDNTGTLADCKELCMVTPECAIVVYYTATYK